MDIEATLAALRQAVRLAPGNTQLILHFCSTLAEYGRYEEAEGEFRDALRDQPNDQQLQLGLARCYFRQAKYSHAMAIMETLESRDRMFPEAQVMYAKLLYQEGSVSAAVDQYRDAVDAEPDVADGEFASLLGIDAFADEDDDPELNDAEIIDGRIRSAAFGLDGPGDDEEPTSASDVERPATSFDDVGGMEEVKEQIRLKIIYPLEHADLYASYGKKIGGGLLLYGPPGCGKTHLARATAGTVKAGFVSIGINDVLDMWMGNSERNLHEIFERARLNRPCVLFFDEVDALGASRSDMKQSAGRHLINQFLAEMDGIDGNNDGLLLIGATNAPWHLDNAFRRPGRFDQVVFVPPPDPAARAEILALHLEGKPQQSIDFTKVGAKLTDFSGADLKSVVDLTVENKLQEAIRTGKPSPITTRDLLAVAKRANPTTREWFATARNHALYSNQGGVYDEILDYLKIKRS